MRNIFKRFSIIAILVLMFFSFSPPSFAQVEELTLRVDGLACAFCAYGLEKKLKSLEGIKSLDISLKKGIAKLVFKEDNNVDLTKIKTMVKNAGYTLRSITLTASGTIHKEKDYFFFDIKGNQNKLYIFDEYTQEELKEKPLAIPLNEEFKKRLEEFFKDKTLLRITGTVHSHPDGSFGLYIYDYSAEGK